LNKVRPLVSIGIPTFNRAEMLKRSIESALNQDYENVEVLISDNASTDQTESFCNYYCEMDSRFKYFRQPRNRGPADNFSEVLKYSTGQFFMWLGDDDWIDPGYVSAGVQQLLDDPAMSLVSGVPQYYRNGQKAEAGKAFDLLYAAWWKRTIAYYAQVADNGMFYGVMRTTQIRQIEMPRAMGGDWIMMAELVSIGKAKMIPEITVHRELGGATASYRQIADLLGLSNFQAVFPMLSIASSAWMDIMAKHSVFKPRPVLSRFLVAGVVFFVILLRQPVRYGRAALRRSRSFLRRLLIRNA
jgi:glycosyltransferase involved in cell wall biosynthesis